jgi:glutathione S-transferase
MAAMHPTLYSFRRCPYAMRARLALAASGQVCALREIALARKPPEMLAASPKGTVPVLVLPDAVVIEQSLDIMLWALHRRDPQAWLPVGEAAMADALQLIATSDGPFKAHLDRYKYPSRYALKNGDANRDQGAVFLAQLESRLATQHFLTGAHFGLTDAAIAPFVRQFAHTDTSWFASQSWPALQRWLQAFESSVLFAAVMEKQPEWVTGSPERLFAPQVRSQLQETL